MAEDPNKPVQIDTELQNLLDSLDDESQEESSIPAASPEIPVTPPLPPPPTPPELVSPDEMAPPDPVSAAEQPPTSVPAGVKIDVILSKFDGIRDKLLANLDDDRHKIQYYIDLFTQNVQGDSPKSVMVEGLVNLLSTKAAASANSIKILDSMAKMLAAAKSISTAESGKSTASAKDIDQLLANDYDPAAP